MTSMDSHLRNKDRGNPGNGGAFASHDRSPDEVTLGNPPTTLEHDGGDIVITQTGPGVYSVHGDPYTASFRAEPDANIERFACDAYDTAVLADMRTRFDEAGGRSVELAEAIDFYEQRLGVRESAFAHLSPGDSEFFTRPEITDATIDFIEVVCTDPEDGEGEPELYANIGVTLDFTDFANEHGVEDTDQWLNEKQNEIDAWLRHNYDDLRFGDMGGEWGDQQLIMDLEFDDPEDFPRTLPDLEAAATEHTRVVELHNDLNGAYGTGHLYGFWTRLGKHLDAVDEGTVESLARA